MGYEIHWKFQPPSVSNDASECGDRSLTPELSLCACIDLRSRERGKCDRAEENGLELDWVS